MAQSQAISKSTVNKIWRAHNVQPHRTGTFKLSRHSKFLEKVTDVVGLYLNPPQEAIILCVDKESQIWVLDGTPPKLPIKNGGGGTITDDCKQKGTTTFFAALESLESKVIGECHERRRHEEFMKFLRRISAEFPGNVGLHLIMDNYGAHKHAKVKAWLKHNPRFVPHFVPSNSSWRNLVERWFGHLARKATRRGVFLSVADLNASIEAFLKACNPDPGPFVWTATIESIQEKHTRSGRFVGYRR